jgi:hypothetical protein
MAEDVEITNMLGPIDYELWLLTILMELVGLLCLFKARAFTRHFTIPLYICSCLAVDVGRYIILGASGYASAAYFYFYYYSGCLTTIALYFVLMGMYSHAFADMGISKYLRGGAMLLLGGTACISYQMVAASTDKLVTRFVIELSRNLYFVGVLLTYLLWGAMMKLRTNRTREMQLVLSLGMYFSALAATYALKSIYPGSMLWRYVSHLMTIWLPLSWAYTFSKVPEEARLATSRVVAPNLSR